MKDLLNQIQKERYDEFCQFVDEKVSPQAHLWDLDTGVTRDIIDQVATEGYLGAIIPTAYGGKGWDFLTYGLLNEAFGRGSSSLTVMFTVQNMVSTVLMKWGSQNQIDKWLEPMAKGDVLASFALTEPNVGSDINNVTVNFTPSGDDFILNGTKRWITFAAASDLYLVFGKQGDQSMACFVEKGTPGFNVTPIHGMLGFKGCHLGQLDFEDVKVPKENMVGKPGFALSYIAPYGLHYGRLSTAFSSLGLIRACLESCSDRAMSRRIGNDLLIEKSAISEKIAGIGVDYQAAALMCWEAANAEDNSNPKSIEKMIAAKYFASRKSVAAAADAVQVLGAFGCHEGSSPVGRYYRDSKIMEIIEGTNQVLENVLGRSYATQFSRTKLISPQYQFN